jgi:AraC-like DNA-binding protein
MRVDAPQPYVPEQLAEVWPVTRLCSLESTRSGVNAAIWTSRQPAEIWAPSTADTNVISMALRPYDCEARADGRLLPFRRCLPSSLQIMPASVTPRAFFSGPMKLLHIYFPHKLLAEFASVEPGALELRDPFANFDQQIANICHQIAEEMIDSSPMSQLYYDTLTVSLGIQLIRRWSNRGHNQETSCGGLASWQLRRVTDFMLDHAEDDLLLEDLAGLVDLSVKHFARAFRQSTGLPPHRWLVNRRIDRARELLGKAELSLAEIALACGFADQSHFTVAFRKATGMTPGAFRREQRP